MATEVVLYEDLKTARDAAARFLADAPVLNNLVATLLAARILEPEPGRCWVAFDGGGVAGMALQSPLDRSLVLTQMVPDIAAAMADAISAEGHDLPGVLGEAAIAARFAGEWTERRQSAAYPAVGQRIYEARTVHNRPDAPGVIHLAGSAQSSLVCNWIAAFGRDIGEPAEPETEFVERRIAAGEILLWYEHSVRSMAAVTAPVLGTSRVHYVYTPEEHRRNGYAEALVRGVTRQLLGNGLRPMLFADLGNPTSNSIYRRIGFAAVAEVVRYRFASSEA